MELNILWRLQSRHVPSSKIHFFILRVHSYFTPIASDGRCQNSSKSLKENAAGIDSHTTRAQAASSNGFRLVPVGSNVHVSHHSVHGVCPAICA